MINLDAAESGYFLRQLEYVKTQTYDIRYPELKNRQLIPVSNEGGDGIETITYEQYDMVGMAKIIASYAQDLPRVDVKGKEFTSRVRSLGDSYGYSVQEIRAAKQANRPLVQRRGDAAKRAMMNLESSLAFLGDTTYNIVGFINHSNVPLVVLPADGTGASKLWANKTPALIIRDLNLLVSAISETTKLTEKPNTLLLPVAKYNYLNNTMMSTTAEKSILKFFSENNTGIRIEAINELTNAGAGGAIDRMVLYDRNPRVLEQHIPVDFEQFDPQPRGLEWIVPCHERYGGVSVYYPLAITYADGF